MTDPRLARYAHLICEHSLGIGESSRLIIVTPPEGRPLALASAREAWRRGARVSVSMAPEWASGDRLREGSAEQVAYLDPAALETVERFDRWLVVWAPGNAAERAGIASERDAALARARLPFHERLDERETAGELRWLGAGFPTALGAQTARMGTAAWERFVYAALLLDEPDPVAAWRALGERHKRLIERLSGVRELHVVSTGTDLLVDVEGRVWESCAGEINLPDGEVFCCPPQGGVEGEILFGVPSLQHGRACRDVRLRFEAGVVVDASAGLGEDVLLARLDTDEGARRPGEFAIGTNEMITRAVGDTIFDEKIGGTCHLALGQGFPLLGGDNVSAIHWDLICDLRSGGRIDADGEPLLVDGRLSV
ncbi:MAG: aminopeptidase [Gaiellales bacterium]|nr:aminopeptidase [Gaiellales bacterium]